MTEISPTLTNYNHVEKASFFQENLALASNSKPSNEPFRALQTQLSDFYMTNSISRASSTMAKCVKAFEQNQKNSRNTVNEQNLKQQQN
jgi:NADH dehydrogenase (ubiquinone) Fe-S protein 1